MIDQQRLNDLNKGDKIDHFLLIRKCDQKLTKNGKPFLMLELGDKSSSLPANLWEDNLAIFKHLKVGTVIKLTGFVEEYQGSLQIKVDEVRLTKESENISPADFLPKSSKNISEMKKEVFEKIEKFSNENLKQLLQQIFSSEILEKYAAAPAGKSWHHSYIGGLLEHTLEIVKICELVSTFHEEINKDLLIAGALLHDFGKIYELTYENSFDYSDEGKLLGHIVICAMFVNEKINQMPSFPFDLRNNLIHLILSHQGKLEQASPVVPKTLEAAVLYHADELSAKANAYKFAIRNELKPDSNWTKYIQLISTELHQHNINL